jgi:hypothetical protein
VLNRHDPVLARRGIKADEEPGTPKKIYRPRATMRALGRVFPEGIPVPEILEGRAIVHLPTMKTRRNVLLSGAAVSALECWLGREALRAEDAIHEALADILAVEHELSAGTVAVMDGVFAGEGPEPRELVPHEKNVILASADPVALDSVALTLMGFYPMGVGYIRMAHEAGIGKGAAADIDLVGDDVTGMRFGFMVEEPPGARGVRAFERALGESLLAPLAWLVSGIYHDWYRFLTVGENRIREAMRGEWGKVFESYRR